MSQGDTVVWVVVRTLIHTVTLEGQREVVDDNNLESVNKIKLIEV